jgi:hypothetical protein
MGKKDALPVEAGVREKTLRKNYSTERGITQMTNDINQTITELRNTAQSMLALADLLAAYVRENQRETEYKAAKWGSVNSDETFTLKLSK